MPGEILTSKKSKTSSSWGAAALAAIAVIVLTALFMHGMKMIGTLAVWWSDSTHFDHEITLAAKRHGIPPELVKALILRESRYRPRAVGKSGEIGLMQLIPPGRPGAVSEWMRVNKRPAPSAKELFQVPLNLEIGCWYLGRAYRKWSSYRCRTELALAEYNAGATRSTRWKPDDINGDVLRRIDIASTVNYVTFIMEHYQRYLREKHKKNQ